MQICSVPDEPDEDSKPRQAPIFVSKPESAVVEEGEWARFCCRVTGHPRPRVMWLINGHTVVNVILQFYNKINIFLTIIFNSGIAIQTDIRWNVSFRYTKNSSI